MESPPNSLDLVDRGKEASLHEMSGLKPDEATDVPTVVGNPPVVAGEDKVDGEAAKKAMEPDIIAAMNRMSTHWLQEVVLPEDGTSYGKVELAAKLHGQECHHTETELASLAKPVLVERIERQATFLKQLTAEGEGYYEAFDPASKEDNEYRRWLETGDVFIEIPGYPRRAFLLQPSSNCLFTYSAYVLTGDTKRPGAGALLIENITLRWMCELGDVFQVPPCAFLEYLLKTPSVTRPENGMRLDGVGVRCKNGEEHIMIPERIEEGHEAAHVKVWSFSLPDSFFLVLFAGNGLATPLTDLPSSAMHQVTTVLSGQPGVGHKPKHGSIDMLSALERFYSDVSKTRRLTELLRQLEFFWSAAKVWKWVFVLSLADKALAELESETRAMGYGVIVLGSEDALDRIKSCRAKVARLRSSNATAFHQWASPVWDEAYDNRWHETMEDACTGLSPQQQQAIASMKSEHDWIEKRAADLMPLLNDQFQLVMAQISIEQGQQAAEQTAASHRLAQISVEQNQKVAEQTAASNKLAELTARDSALSIKNSERSTLLTLLAAIYLPLTLATGVFGMNIKDIDSDTVRFWWVIVVWICLMVPSGVLVAYIFWRSERNFKKAVEKANKHD